MPEANLPSSVWSKFSHDPRQPQVSHLRASDGDREVAQQTVSDAFADGRLDREEFEERSRQVWAAKTYGEFPPLLTDLVPLAGALVRRSNAAQLQAAAEQAWRHRMRERLSGWLSLALVLTVIWYISGGGSGLYWPAIPLVVLGGGVISTALNRSEIVAKKRRSLEQREDKDIRKLEQRSRKPPSPDQD